MRRRTPTQFAAWLRNELTRRGYVLTPRGGGQKSFASDAGVSTATVSRILRGEGVTDLGVLEKIATSLGVRLGTILVEAGLLEPDELGSVQRPRGHMSADEAADELGITDPTARQVFRGMVNTLKPGDPTAG